MAKLIDKHNVYPNEVEEIFNGDAIILSNSDIYVALGQSEAGRYLTVVFRKLSKTNIKIITAREMTQAEKNRYRGRGK